MENFFTDNDDLQYYMEKGLDWESLVKLTEYDFASEDGYKSTEEAVSFYKDLLASIGDFSANAIAPRSKEIDEHEMKFANGEVEYPEAIKIIFQKIADMGLHGLCVPRELGGLNSPLALYFITTELIARGDSSVMAHFGFHGGIALAMLMYSVVEGSTEFKVSPPAITKTRFQKEISEIINGKYWGSMDITEPGAGSDMAAIATTAEKDSNGNWTVSGSKIFITSGHGKFHFVLAKTEKGESNNSFDGLKQLSLFMVPAYEEDKNGNKKRTVTIDGLEKKLGIHGSATVALNFDRAPAYLVGRRGEGFKLMLLLMNNARISVAFESLGVCESAYRLAKKYASERPSMGKNIEKHEIIADYLEEMQTDILGIRALSMHAAYHEEMSQKLKIKMIVLKKIGDMENLEKIEKLQKRHEQASRKVTPIIKYIGAEKAVEITRRCIQIHGGFGYTREYGAEKLLRDALIFPIYEGTSQIQSLMAMKDTLGAVIKNPAKFLRHTIEAQSKSIFASDPLEKKVGKIQLACQNSIQNLIARVAMDKIENLKNIPLQNWIDVMTQNWNPKKDFGPALLHAEHLTIMLADRYICEVLLEQSKKHPERRDILVRYIERAEHRVQYMSHLIEGTGDRLLEKLKGADINES